VLRIAGVFILPCAGVRAGMGESRLGRERKPNPVNASRGLNIKRACRLRAGARSLLILYPYGYGFTTNSKEMAMEPLCSTMENSTGAENR
jgi:hypothetical protein